jgi:hypothetical protein
MPSPAPTPLLKRLSYTGIIYVFIIFLAIPVSSSSTQTTFFKDPDKLYIQFITEQNTLVDSSGREFSLDNVLPYNNLFSTKSFVTVNHGNSVVNKHTKEVLGISVYRGKHIDGSTILLSKNTDGKIDYVIISGQAGQDSTHFIRVEEEPGAFLTIADEDYDYDLIAEMFVMGEEVEPSSGPTSPVKAPTKAPSKGGKGQSGKKKGQRRSQEFEYTNGDGTSEECESFLVIPVSIFFDAEFCQLYGGDLLGAVGAVQIIVAAASLHYENNLCSRLELSGINWDTTSCNPDNSVFQDFNREMCGPYLDDFTVYMEAERDGLGLDSASWVHLFTGLPISDNLGCAWLPGACFSEFVYAVDYMSFMAPDVRGQAFIFAHELGHNLNASHDPTSPDPPNYIMEARFNDASDGFSEISAANIIEALLDPLNLCVEREFPSIPTPAPTGNPTPVPTIPPTQGPTPEPTQLPTLAPSPSPTTASPTILPTIENVQPPVFSPTPLPTASPVVAPQTPNPTTTQPSPAPTPQPTASPITISPPPSPFPTPFPPPDQCDLGRQLVDPVCIDANENSNDDYTCYDKENLLVFSATTDACRSRVELTVESCVEAFLPIPGSSSRAYSYGAAQRVEETNSDDRWRQNLLQAFRDDDPDSFEDRDSNDNEQHHLQYTWMDTYRPLQTSRGRASRANGAPFKSPPSDWTNSDPFQKQVDEEPPPLPFCSESCSEVVILNQICFQSSTLPDLDRWFGVRYRATDPLTQSTQRATIFVVIKRDGQLECSDDAVVLCRSDDGVAA